MQRKILFSILTLALIPFFYNACSQSSNTAPNSANKVPVDDPSATPDFSKLTPTCFVPETNNPIIRLGSFFSDSLWNDPHVIKVENQFIMYATADTIGRLPLPVHYEENIKIYRLVSTDAKNWTLSPSIAVFERPTDPMAWDGKSTETPSVVFFKGQYHMFYTGYANQKDPVGYKIGHAASTDGISWTRRPGALISPTNPTAGPSCNAGITECDFMQYVVGEPGAVVFNEKIYLYFMAQGVVPAEGRHANAIALTTSTDGVTWGTPQKVLAPDRSIYPFATWRGYSTPNAVVLNNQVHLFFDVVYDTTGSMFSQEKIHHAFSVDGISDWTTDGTALFDRSQFSWSDYGINGPSVLQDGKNLYIWFGGQGNVSAFPNMNFGIAMATCRL